MDFAVTPEEQAMVDSVASVLARECPTSLVRHVVEHGSTPEQPWESARALGWTAIDLPVDLGGLELGFTALGLVVEQHGRRIAPGPFLATVTQFLPLVREAGSREALHRFAVPAGAGQLRGALAIDHGSAPRHEVGESVRARRDGDGWVLDGDHAFVLDGDLADEIAVAARVDEGDGVGLFVVPRGTARASRVVGLDASRPLAHLRLESVRLGPDRVLGTPGESAGPLGRAIDRATVAAALECVGACQSLLEMTVEHAKTRHQFDQPIGAFQAIQHKCADMFVQLEKARATAYFAMMAVAEADPRRSLAASLAKAAASDCQRLVCNDGLQVHGGMGFTWESDLHLYLKRAKTLEAMFGSGRAHRQRIAELLEV